MDTSQIKYLEMSAVYQHADRVSERFSTEDKLYETRLDISALGRMLDVASKADDYKRLYALLARKRGLARVLEAKIVSLSDPNN